MTKSYSEMARFHLGDAVKVIGLRELEAFAREWKYHHRPSEEHMAYAGTSSIVCDVSFYHGGDRLYGLEGQPEHIFWLEQCLLPGEPNGGSQDGSDVSG